MSFLLLNEVFLFQTNQDLANNANNFGYDKSQQVAVVKEKVIMR